MRLEHQRSREHDYFQDGCLSAEALPPDAEFLILSRGEEGATATGTGDMRETVAEAAKESDAIQLRKRGQVHAQTYRQMRIR